MSILKKLRDRFTPIDGEDMSRRKFITDAASLAALTVVAGVLPSALVVQDIQAHIERGIVQGQSFNIYEPVIIDIPGVTIVDCHFTAMAPMPYMIRLGPNANHTLLSRCHLDTQTFDVGAGIYVDAQAGDMTKTFQSAFDTASNVRLSSGVYQVSAPIRFKTK